MVGSVCREVDGSEWQLLMLVGLVREGRFGKDIIPLRKYLRDDRLVNPNSESANRSF